MILVLGAGIVGCSTAADLAARGVPVTLVDRGDVSSGTTGLGEGNVLCADKDAGPELDLAVAGRALYAELEDRLGVVAAIRRKGALIVHPLAETWAGEPARLERLRAAGVEAELVGPDGVRELEPALTGDVHGAMWVPGDLQCDPRSIARALAEEARGNGATILTHTEVTRIGVAAGGVAGVTLADGTRLHADAVVLAAGPWSAPLAATAGLHLPVEPRKGQLVQLAADAPGHLLRRKVVDGSYLLSVTSAAEGRQVSTVVETTAEGDVVVGSSRERCGFDPTVDDALIDEVRARAARLVPAVGGLPLRRVWVGFRPWLPDHLPAIGESTAIRGLWVGTGHEGAGVGLGPITGRVLADGLCGNNDREMDRSPFAPDRFTA